MSTDKRSPLYEEHERAEARMVPFAGFLMPVQYSGIIAEHRAVRNGIGMFDLSHMGEFRLIGPGALTAVDHLTANDTLGLEPGQVRYTPLCYADGGIVDDILVYRFPDFVMLVVNAANIDKDLGWIRDHLHGEVRIEDISQQVGLIAIQGPEAETFLQTLTGTDLSSIAYYHFLEGQIGGVPVTISRTGYTGEDGFELYVSAEEALALWRVLRENGRPAGLVLAGLGARDTLRLEAGYMLYGNDIDQSTSPLEAGLGWTVKLPGREFVGSDALVHQKSEGLTRRMAALEMLDRGIPRPHCPIWINGAPSGEVTSGTFSPTFNLGIGLGYVPAGAKISDEIQVEIRGEKHPARLVRKPMYKREGA